GTPSALLRDGDPERRLEELVGGGDARVGVVQRSAIAVERNRVLSGRLREEELLFFFRVRRDGVARLVVASLGLPAELLGFRLELRPRGVVRGYGRVLHGKCRAGETAREQGGKERQGQNRSGVAHGFSFGVLC